MQLNKPGLLRLILRDLRAIGQGNRLASSLAKAQARLLVGDPDLMQQLALQHSGQAWLALADYYAERRTDQPALATEAYRQALLCTDWLGRPHRLTQEYDRRRFLGIGVDQDLKALTKEWKGSPIPGDGREIQLAWIHACGPAELRDLNEAWWWVALAEARWGQCKDVALPTLCTEALREHIAQAVPGEVQRRLDDEAKTCAYAEFVSGK